MSVRITKIGYVSFKLFFDVNFRLRVLQSKKFGTKLTPKKNASEPGTSTPKLDQSKSKTPSGDDDDEEKGEDDEDDEDKDEDEEEEEEGGGEDGGEEAEEEEADGITMEEIQKKIEKLQKVCEITD